MGFDKMIRRTVEELRQEASGYVHTISKLADGLTSFTQHDFKPAYGDKGWDRIFAVREEIKEAVESDLKIRHGDGHDVWEASWLGLQRAFYDVLGRDMVFIPEKINEHCYAFMSCHSSKDEEPIHFFGSKGKSNEFKEGFERTREAITQLLRQPEFANVLEQVSLDLNTINIDVDPSLYSMSGNDKITIGLARYIYESREVWECRMSRDTLPKKTLNKYMFKGEVDGVLCNIVKTSGSELKKVHWKSGVALVYSEREYDYVKFSEVALSQEGSKIHFMLAAVPAEHADDLGMVFTHGGRSFRIDIEMDGTKVDFAKMQPENIVKLLKSIKEKLNDYYDYLQYGHYFRREDEKQPSPTVKEIVDLVGGAPMLSGYSTKLITGQGGMDEP